MDIMLSTVVQAINDALARNANKYETNTAKAGKEPVCDKDGRLHAPCNGYVWNDTVYGGGEYLDDCGDRDIASVRYLINANDEYAFRGVDGVSISFGAEFNGKKYAYFEAPRYIINSLPVLEEKIIMCASTHGVGKCWKFSYKKWYFSENASSATNGDFIRLQALDKKMVGYYRPILRP